MADADAPQADAASTPVAAPAARAMTDGVTEPPTPSAAATPAPAELVALSDDTVAALENLSAATLETIAPLLDRLSARLLEIKYAATAMKVYPGFPPSHSPVPALFCGGRERYRTQQEAALVTFQEFQSLKTDADLDRVVETVRGAGPCFRRALDEHPPPA